MPATIIQTKPGDKIRFSAEGKTYPGEVLKVFPRCLLVEVQNERRGSKISFHNTDDLGCTSRVQVGDLVEIVND